MKKKNAKSYFRHTPAYELIKASKARGVWWRPSTPSTPTLEILGEVKFMDQVSADNVRMGDGVHAVNTFATQSSLRSVHSVEHFLYRER